MEKLISGIESYIISTKLFFIAIDATHREGEWRSIKITSSTYLWIQFSYLLTIIFLIFFLYMFKIEIINADITEFYEFDKTLSV